MTTIRHRYASALGILVLASSMQLSNGAIDRLSDAWTDSPPFGRGTIGEWGISTPHKVWAGYAGAVPGIRATANWSTPQPSWGFWLDPDHGEGVFKSNGTEQFLHAWTAGDTVADLGSQEQVVISWSPPTAMTVTLSGRFWIGTDFPGDVTVVVQRNLGDTYASYNLSPSLNFGRANAQDLVLENIRLEEGQRFDILIGSWPRDERGFVAFELAVTAVPEPSTCVAGALLVVPLALQAVRRFRTQQAKNIALRSA